jgi:hypothetical protein
VIGQNLWVRSLTTPETSLNPYPNSSPNPATTPTTVPLAPSTAKNGPVIARAPSYVRSAKKLSAPISSTKFMAARRIHSLATKNSCQHR